MNADDRVAIVVLNWNGKELTRNCLSSLQKLTYPHYEIFLVDNGSTDDSIEVLRKEFPSIRLIETHVNLGYAGGNNIGIDLARKEGFLYILVLNNDTAVDPNLLQSFLSSFSDPSVGVVGAKILRMDEPDRIDHFGGIWNPKRMDFDYVGYRELESQASAPPSLDYVCGAAIMVRSDVFDKVGLFDPRFFLFFEEADFCARAKKAGYQIRVCLKAKIWHKISASFVSKPHGAYFLSRNRLLWIEKNFSGKKKLLYFLRLFFTLYFPLIGYRLFRKGQKGVQQLFHRDFSRNTDRLIRLTAKKAGMDDYVLRRFYAGRSKNFMNCH